MVPGIWHFLFLFISQRSNKLSCSAEDYKSESWAELWNLLINEVIREEWGSFFSVFMTGPQGNLPTILDSKNCGGKVQKCIMIYSVTELKKILLLLTSGICCLKKILKLVYTGAHFWFVKQIYLWNVVPYLIAFFEIPRGSHCIQQSYWRILVKLMAVMEFTLSVLRMFTNWKSLKCEDCYKGQTILNSDKQKIPSVLPYNAGQHGILPNALSESALAI